MGVDGSHSPAGHNWGSRRAHPPNQSVTSCTPALAGSARSHAQELRLGRAAAVANGYYFAWACRLSLKGPVEYSED